MNIQGFFRCLIVLTIASIGSFAYAATYDFQIEEGVVFSTPSFCPPERCISQKGAVKGFFTAQIEGGDIFLSNINIESEVIGFDLPKNPNSSSNGSVFIAKFNLSGTRLELKGSINSTAFDGPLQEYHVVANIVDDQSSFDALGFYRVRQDFRKCISPMCGGIYVSKVNRNSMKCPNGTRSRECYIGTVNWEKIGGSPFSVEDPIVKGDITEDTLLKSEWGVFTAESAYRPVSSKKSKKTVFGLMNNGIVCISSPCYSFDEYVINRQNVRKISDVDLSRVKASKKDLELANQLMANGKTLIAAGYNRRYKGFSNIGIRFIATQFYLPIENASDVVCKEGYTLTDFGCATRHNCFYPQLELATFSGVASKVAGVVSSDVSYSCVDTCEFPAEPAGNGYCVLALP